MSLKHTIGTCGNFMVVIWIFLCKELVRLCDGILWR